jgi:hypothetical protein
MLISNLERLIQNCPIDSENSVSSSWNLRLRSFGDANVRSHHESSCFPYSIIKSTGPLDGLFHFAENPARHYCPMILERAGKEPREIQVPRTQLAGLQRRILNRVFRDFRPHDCSFGGIKGRSAVENVKRHLDKEYVLKIDVRKFFPSIHHRWVQTFFQERLGCIPPVADLLRRLVTLNSGLPQGTCTSPALADQIMNRIDVRLRQAFEPRGITYGRWIDDITISAAFSLRSFIGFVDRILAESGLHIHRSGEKKPHQFGPGEEAIVTGLSCRGRVCVPLRYVNAIKTELWIAWRYSQGYAAAPPPYCKESYWGTIQYISRFRKSWGRELAWLFNRVDWEKLVPLELPSKKPRLRRQLA